MTDNKQIAKTILEQLGGNRFSVMTGAHSFTADGNSLIFKLPRTGNAKRIAGVKITLDANDTYTMEFFAFKGSLKAGNYRCENVAKHTGIYCDMLADIFTEETGLNTSL
jgi:hypothetical protein